MAEPQYEYVWMKFAKELLLEKQGPEIVAQLARNLALRMQRREGLVDDRGQWIGAGVKPAVRDNAPNA